MTEYVQGRPAELRFNLDEVGISNGEDRKSKKVMVPQSMRGQTIHQKLNRPLQHISVIACGRPSSWDEFGTFIL
jgi:hypothetical protein